MNNYLTRKVFIKEGYVVKKTNRKSDKIYQYLNSQNVHNVVYPEKKYVLNNEKYLEFPYYDEIDYPSSKKLLNLKDAIMELHDKTKTMKVIKKRNMRYFYKIYYKLDMKFSLLELYIRECENNVNHNDNDWIILSKYHIYLDCKKELYRLQKKLHNLVDKNTSAYYAVNHFKPDITHLVNNSLISLDHAKIAIVTSDIAKIYVANEYIDIDWFNFVDSWLNNYEGEIYKVYFKFLVLYIFILNVNIDNVNEYTSLNSYVQINNKIKKFLLQFNTY